jgi:hypothetical protein
MSGGTVFGIVFISLFGAYIVVGMLLTYRQERAWYCPNRFFWAKVVHVSKGVVLFAIFCGKPGEDAGGGSLLRSSGAAAAAPTASSSFAASSAFGAGNPYQAGPARSSGYSDL